MTGMIKQTIGFETSNNPKKLFNLDIEDGFPNFMIGIIRNHITNMKLGCENPKLELLIKLFHKDETFKDMCFKNIKYELFKGGGFYLISLIQVCDKKYNIITIEIEADLSWKSFKKRIMNIKLKEDCLFCCELTYSKILCSTCNQILCKTCIIKQYEKAYHLNCPMCKSSLDEMSKDMCGDLIKQTPLELRHKVATDFVNFVFT